jgi:hypothetical protein
MILNPISLKYNLLSKHKHNLLMASKHSPNNLPLKLPKIYNLKEYLLTFLININTKLKPISN